MVAAPFALTGIGAAAGLSVLAASLFFANMSRRRRDNQNEEIERVMEVAEERMAANQEWLSKHGEAASGIQKRLIRTTAVLEYISGASNDAKPDQAVSDVGQALLDAERLIREMDEDPIPHESAYLVKPGVVTTISRIEATRDSLHIVWEDPDDGQTEISEYRFKYSQGFWGRDEETLNVCEPEVTISDLESGNKYSFTITAINTVGEGEESEEFEAATT